MATVWSPAPYINKQEWLLADGSIVVSPDFETSSSGRRIRVAGTKTSFGNTQVAALIDRAIDQIAADRNTTKVMRLFTSEEDDMYAASVAGLSGDVFTETLSLHLLKPDKNRYGGRTTAVWKFEAESRPIHAYLFISLDQRRGDESYAVRTSVVFRNLLPGYGVENDYIVWDGTYTYSSSLYRHSGESARIKDHLLADQSLPFRPAETGYTGQMRTAVVRFAELAKVTDTVDEIELPDLRCLPSDVTEPLPTMKFKRVATNYSSAFHSQLLDFVQTGPTVERIKQKVSELLDDFKMLGIKVMAGPDDNDFARAVNGDPTAIKCVLQASEDTDKSSTSIDPHHTVSFDFASGTMVVNCGHSNDLDEVAEAWEIAKFKAEMLGESDVLVEYAKAYQKPREQKRLAKIIKQRAVPDIQEIDGAS